MNRLLPLVLVIGCNSGPEPQPEPPLSGDDVYLKRIDGANTFTCSTCHALSEPSNIRRAGHPIGGAPMRGSYKNGRVSSFLEAVNSCLVEWMAGEPWTDDDERFVALTKYLEEQPGISTPISFEIVQPPSNLEGGAGPAGRNLFNGSCAICHGEDASGTERALGLIGFDLQPDYIALRVRTSGLPTSPVYDGLTGGRMPFWAADRLSDPELRDLIAFIRTTEPDPNPDPNPDPDPDPDPDPSMCISTHGKIGQTATLTTRFHGVRGSAVIVDDCTIELRDFFFDGGGIDVQVYAGKNGDYRTGFSISSDLTRAGGYQGETITLKLPDGRTLDDLDGVSIWCVAVGVDFGSGLFQ